MVNSGGQAAAKEEEEEVEGFRKVLTNVDRMFRYFTVSGKYN